MDKIIIKENANSHFILERVTDNILYFEVFKKGGYVDKEIGIFLDKEEVGKLKKVIDKFLENK